MRKRNLGLMIAFTMLLTLLAPMVRAEAADTYKVKAGKKITLSSSLKNPVWGSTDTSVATVSDKGVVKGIKKGTCYVTATADNKSELFKISVTKKAKKTTTTETDPGKTTDKTEKIKDKVIFDNHGVVVTLNELKDNNDLSFTVESSAEDPVTFLVSDVAVNNCKVYDESSYSKYVTKGNKSFAKYNLDGMKKYGITQIKTIDIVVEVMIDYDIYSKHVKISTNLDDGKAFVPEFENTKEVYSDKNVDVYVIKTGKGLKDFELLFHNKSKYMMETYFTGIAVNGIMTENMYSWGDGAFAGGYCYTGASNDSVRTIWSALDEEIKARGFDSVSKITGNLGVWLEPEPTGEVSDFDLDEMYIDQYSVPNVSIYPVK